MEANSVKYQNEYGTVVLTPVTDFVHVNTVFGKDIDDKYKFAIDDGANIALITENRNVQLAVENYTDEKGKFRLKDRMYILLHDTANLNMCAFCHVEMTVVNMEANPHEEIERLNKYRYCY